MIAAASLKKKGLVSMSLFSHKFKFYPPATNKEWFGFFLLIISALDEGITLALILSGQRSLDTFPSIFDNQVMLIGLLLLSGAFFTPVLSERSLFRRAEQLTVAGLMLAAVANDIEPSNVIWFLAFLAWSASWSLGLLSFFVDPPVKFYLPFQPEPGPYAIRLTKIPTNQIPTARALEKIMHIKAVELIRGDSLDNLPLIVATGVSESSAEEIKDRIEAAGGTVEIGKSPQRGTTEFKPETPEN